MAERPPLVSIVTPVHNGAAFLRECIESILRQTYPHWEYVIVDNCSIDESLAIAEHYGAQHEQIRVLSTPSFLESMDSQNFALRRISPESKYCKVVHADDWLFPECVASMVAVAESHPSVGIVSAYRLDGASVSLDGLPYPSTCVSGREIARLSLLGGPYVFGSPTSLLLRSEIVRSRPEFYVDRAPWTDVDVCYDILKTWDFGFVHQVMTFTRRHEGAQSAFAVRFNSHILGRLVLFKRYGRDFLTEDEIRKQSGAVIREYRQFLLRSAMKRRDRAFWDYHIRGLASAGHPLKFHHLVLTAASMFLRPMAIGAGRLMSLIREQVFRQFPATPPT